MSPATTLRELRDRAEVEAALPGDWLLRQILAHWADDLPAYALGGAVAVYHRFGEDPDPVVIGEPGDALALARVLLERHRPEYLSLPRAAGGPLLAEGLEDREGWAFRWTGLAPGLPVAGDAAWLPDDAEDEVRAFLAEAFPEASLPVGHPDVRRWAGLRRAGRLVAVAADASVAPGLGFLASIASRPDARGTGAGAAVTAWSTAALVAEHGSCGLWHMGANSVAAGLYTRLGFTDDHQMAVVRLPA